MSEVSITVGDRAVWVNNSRTCIGRFGKLGIDIHSDLDPETGEPLVAPNGQNFGHCLMCTHGPVTEQDWDRFVEGMKQHHGVDIPPYHKPEWW